MISLLNDIPFLLKCIGVFLRISILLSLFPFFGDQFMPLQARILLSVAMSFVFVPTLAPDWGLPPDFTSGDLFHFLAREVMFGVVLGFMTKLIFEAYIMASNLVGYQMGFGTANLFFADSDSQMTSFSHLHRLLTLMMFLGLNLHYVLLHALSESFQWIPFGGGVMKDPFYKMILMHFVKAFVISLQMAAPILFCLFLSMGALGLMSKAVPQLNVFTLSFPVGFFLGLASYCVLLPLLPGWLKNHYLENAQAVFDWLKIWNRP